MALKTYDVKKLFIVFYLIIPVIFYSVPLIFVYDTGEFKVHFYSTYIATYDDIIKILFGHFILGLCIFYLFKSVNYEIKKQRKNIFYDILILFVMMIILVSSGIIAMLAWALFFIIIGNIILHNMTYFFLLLLAFLNLVFNGERILFVFVLTIWSLGYISKISIGKLLFLVVLGVIGLVYILQPLKYGEIPFSNFENPLEGLGYLLQHVFPIYYTAFLSTNIDFSTTSLIAEFIPFGKSLSGELGVVEKLAIEGLPVNIISEGGRLGSNSSMYFSFTGIFLLFFMLFMIKLNVWMLESRILINSLLIYFVIQGPYFIRRSFASFTIDIIVIIFWVILISFIIMMMKNLKKGDG